MLHKLANEHLRTAIGKLARQNLTPRAIGERLGITAESVRKRARNAGIILAHGKRGPAPGHPERDATIVQRYKAGDLIRIIAADLGITEGVVAGAIARAGVPKRFGSVTPDEIARIRKLHRAGHSVYRIGQIVGRSANAVRRAIGIKA